MRRFVATALVGTALLVGGPLSNTAGAAPVPPAVCHMSFQQYFKWLTGKPMSNSSSRYLLKWARLWYPKDRARACRRGAVIIVVVPR